MSVLAIQLCIVVDFAGKWSMAVVVGINGPITVVLAVAVVMAVALNLTIAVNFILKFI